MNSIITVGTRGSDLALRQTSMVVDALKQQAPIQEFAVQTVRSEGDRMPNTPLDQLGDQWGRGVFVGELETVLLTGQIDLAVHSLKDLPTNTTDGLAVVSVLERADPRDVLVNRWGLPLAELPLGARIGTSSPRREAQLRSIRQDLVLLPIRGNVETRVAKTQGADYDGAILAAAGLERLGLGDWIAEYLSAEVCTPSPGQGALAVEVRSADVELLALVKKLEQRETALAVEAERWVLRAAGGDCQAPIGALAVIDGSNMRLVAASSSLDGSATFRTTVIRPTDDPENVGRAAYQSLLDNGAVPSGKDRP